MLFLVIRLSTLVDVGAFGLVYTTFFMLLAAARGLSTEPLIVRYVGVPENEWRQAAGSAAGVVLALGLAVGSCIFVCGVFWGGTVGLAFAAMAVVLPGLFVQDAWRLALFSQGNPRSACANDAVFLVIQILVYVSIAWYGTLTMIALIVGWGMAATAAAAFGVIQTRTVPRLRRVRSWLRAHKDIGPAFAADYVVNRGAEQITLVVISAVGGLGALGAVTASRSLFAPLTTVQSGINSFALPEIARLHAERQFGPLHRFLWTVAIGMGMLMLAGGLVLWLVPQGIGTAIFNDNWRPARSLLLVMTVFSILNAVGYGLWIGLRGMAVAKETLVFRGVFGLVMVLAAGIGVHFSGAAGAVWGMALAAAGLGAGMAWLVAKTLRHQRIDGTITRDHEA